VPEHFNLPWHLALQTRKLEPLGIDLTWRDYPGGSGAMAKALRDGELDAAVLLTEGAVAAVSDGVALEIASLYTDSPLVWGIHVPAASRYRSVAELERARYAISRKGSGSHLMAFVHARAQGWPVTGLALVVVDSLEGAVAAFAAGQADVFFWEKFMTKPLVDAGTFRRVGEFTAPWPAFVVCIARAAGAERRAALGRALAVVLDEARALRLRPAAAELIAARYGLKAADARDWLAATQWSTRVGVTARDVAPACSALGALGVLPRVVDAAACIAPVTATP
jgi:ABC-type nitrate/sulfonate/bicarbonate transport system substrate-binding protein